MEIAYFIGLTLCLIGFLSNSALLFGSNAKGPLRAVFLITYVMMIVWSLGYALGAAFSQSTFFVSPLLESLQIGMWSLLLLSILDNQPTSMTKMLRSKYVLTIVFLIIIFNFAIFSPFFDQAMELRLVIAGSLLGSIIQLILIEQIYRNAGDQKWAYKPLVLGLAMVNIFHLIMMSNALLLSAVDVNYLASRPYIYAMLTPLLLLSMKRVKSWDLSVFISRDVVLNSSLLLFSGGYLLVMAMTGYVIQQIGATWSGVLQIVFIAGALVALAYIFVSESLRKYFKTYIQKHFYANQFDYREEWLKLTNTLNENDVNQDFYSTSLKGVCGSLHYSTGAYIMLQHEHLELVTPDLFGLSHQSLLELHCLIPNLEQSHWIIDLPEFERDEYKIHFSECKVESLVKDGIEIILPIFINDKLHGCFLLSSKNADRIKVNWEIKDYLTAVSSQVSSFIKSNEAKIRLEENAKFAAFNRMSAFVVHDLKNVIAQIGMIVSNGKKFRDNPEFIDDTFETLEHTKERMDKMLSQLKDKQQQRSSAVLIELNETLSAVVSEFKNALPNPVFVPNSSPLSLDLDKDRFSSVIGHLIDNAQQATDETGSVLIKVTLDKLNQTIKVIISDTGIGMTQEFIDNQLFKPFETTKGNAGMGVGVYEAKTFAQENNGSLTVSSDVGLGTTFILALPFE
ncbi:PEP-CTERM system histidine kinase PrsK [Psychrosphaera sp.]|nr:PEP-CTERM system histidine kinase PrsK [Psychrosphaera sp.]